MKDEYIRCGWVDGSELYQTYHDVEWGVPQYDDSVLFEFLTLELFQSGLSWITILKKRENFRAAFDQFDYGVIAEYDQKKIDSLLANAGIVRNRMKIESTITNARVYQEVIAKNATFASLLWSYVDGIPIINRWKSQKEVPASTDLSKTISKELKAKGFRFVGPTVIYAFMQAVGMVNDHTTDCFCHPDNIQSTK